MPPLDLSKFSAKPLLDTELNPRELFNLLSQKNKKYAYLRDVQAEVLTRWYDRRTDKDTVLKMNTGGGKTVVGLLLLKSCLNERIAPAFYVAADNYLVDQVIKEAKELGIDVSTEPDDHSVLQGKSIAVINIHTLINGKSRFGVGDEGQKIKIGAIVIDDAHACLATTENQFCISVDANTEIYKNLLSLFKDNLLKQNDSKYFELESGDPSATMLVPFYAWSAKQNDVVKLLSAHRSDDSIQFNWPLIKSHLSLCRCVFNGHRVEITPFCLPIDSIQSFCYAKRRIFMTATLADDSILVSHLDADPDLVSKHITPRSASDIGDRMILVPQEIDPSISDDQLRDFLVTKAKTLNVVVIVPSKLRSEYWRDAATKIVDTTQIGATVTQLKTGHVGLVVLINRYDGVDLPNDACRILVLDGLPQAKRLIDQIENNMLHGSEQLIGRQIQRIEQGMGRGIRSNDDYCVVLLMGRSLTRDLFSFDAINKFSPATQAQLSLSEEVTKQLGDGLHEIEAAMDYCLTQTPQWRKVAREALSNITYPEEADIRGVAVSQRHAFDAASIGDFKGAMDALQSVINDPEISENPVVKGWLKWQFAEYQYFTDSSKSQETLKSALQINRALPKPLEGIEYEKLKTENLSQAKNSAWAIRSYDGNKNKLLIDVNGTLDDLIFLPETSNRFEQAFKNIAKLLGFEAQRPENDYGKGPDVLWAVGNLQYIVIECKNGATNPIVNKADCNQLNGSANWFISKYDHSCAFTPLIVHPSNKFEYAASPHSKTRVMTNDDLDAFKNSVLSYVQAAASKLSEFDTQEAGKLLAQHHLLPDLLLNKFTRAPKATN